jgi:fructose-1,6-bisphosphatase/sedoheptulose 1,7-bisphosphatase-like protein
MGTLRLATLEGGETVLDAATLRALEGRVQGPLLRAGESRYDEARTVWNRAVVWPAARDQAPACR